MNIITKNKSQTVGIVTDVSDLKDVGDFSLVHLKEWLKQITACHEGSDPKVAVCGHYRLDGKKWGGIDEKR